jgi:hypothetical protein
LKRVVAPEILDTLPPGDPRAARARRDLRRINTFMGNVGLLAKELARFQVTGAPLSLVELGAGDGDLSLRVLEKLRPTTGSRMTFLDGNAEPRSDVLVRLRQLGWDVATVRADVFDWLEHREGQAQEVIFANLFLHHFGDPDLSRLLAACAQAGRGFVAVEPRRSRPAVFFSSLIGLVSCGSVIRHDAVVSVRAGFQARELSALWRKTPGWTVEEFEGNSASHVFTARRGVAG